MKLEIRFLIIIWGRPNWSSSAFMISPVEPGMYSRAPTVSLALPDRAFWSLKRFSSSENWPTSVDRLKHAINGNHSDGSPEKAGSSFPTTFFMYASQLPPGELASQAGGKPWVLALGKVWFGTGVRGC